MERRRVPFADSSNDWVNHREKTPSAWERKMALPLYRTTATAKVPPRSALDSKDEQTVPNGVLETYFPKMVPRDHPVYQEEHAAQVRWRGDLIYLQWTAEYICADL